MDRHLSIFVGGINALTIPDAEAVEWETKTALNGQSVGRGGGGVDIGPDLVRRLIDDQFPKWGHLPIQQIEPGGWDNRTFRLGSTMTVRLPSHAAYEAQVAKEQQWLPTLAAHVPVAIPVPIAEGLPSDEYPWHWSIYRWIEGTTAHDAAISDLKTFAGDVAQFLLALQRTNPVGGPSPGPHNFYRGGSLAVYDRETREAIQVLDSQIDIASATAVWDAALESCWDDPPVWVHGDISSTNLLVQNGRLRAVIDFGCLGIGDPACDLVIAWTFFSGLSREAFCRHLEADDRTWARARGWAIWKALITLADPAVNRLNCEEAGRVINDVISGFKRHPSPVLPTSSCIIGGECSLYSAKTDKSH